jgi:hypothetical protein
VRQAIEKQNDELKAEGKSQVAAEPLLEIAERLRHRSQAAAWRDRADAALAQVDELDLRDLRSVVNAADDGGRDEEARNVAAQLREALANRVEKEQAAWVEEVAENLREGRVVRALRLSSRPPKAGSPLPPDISTQLVEATSAALTSETGPQRWATVLDALAFSPIRRRVVPASLPDKLGAELRGIIARLGTRLPEIAHIFDITPEDAPSRPPRRSRPGAGPGGSGPGGESKPKSKRRERSGPKPAKPAAPAETPADTTAPPEAAVTTDEAPATAEPAAPAAEAAPTPGAETPPAAETAPEVDEAPEATVEPAAAEAATSDEAATPEVAETPAVAETADEVDEAATPEADADVEAGGDEAPSNGHAEPNGQAAGQDELASQSAGDEG